MAELDYGHVPALLESVSLKYKNSIFRINELLPLVHVLKRSDKILVNDMSNVFTRHKTARGQDGRSNFVSFNEHTVEFSCKNHALHTYVSDKLVKNANPALQPLIRATEGLTEKILLDREIRGAEYLGDTANYNTAFKQNIAAAWGDLTASNPVEDILAAKGSMLTPPNVFAVGDQDFRSLIQHPAFKQYISGGATADSPAVMTAEVLASILGVERVIVFASQYRTNPDEPDASATWEMIWDNFAGLYYVEGLGEDNFLPELDMTSFGFMASWDPDQKQRPTRVNVDFNMERDGGSHFLEAEEDTDITISIPEVGFLFYNLRS